MSTTTYTRAFSLIRNPCCDCHQFPSNLRPIKVNRVWPLMVTRTSAGRKPVGQVEEMASKRRQKSNDLKTLLDNFEERFKRQDKRFEECMEDQSKQFEQRFEEQQNQITTLTTDLRSSRRDIRAFSYCQMTYLNNLSATVLQIHVSIH